ncbi:MAG: DUF3159 domain-containing protein [Actinomycetes bacterium]
MTSEPPVTRRALRDATRARTGGIAQAAGEDFSLAEAVGGPRGVVEAVLPGLLFVSWFTVTRELGSALTASLLAAGLLVVARVVTRSNPTQALGGLIGVGICAWAASRTGDAVDFYAPGFLLNIGYAVVYAASTVRYPRVGPVPAWGPFPVIGLLIGPLVGEGLAWRHDPRRLRAYRQVTWLWVGMFALRLVVQLPLYFAGAVGALGVARLVMGVPLFALTAWLTWLVLRRVPAATPR